MKLFLRLLALLSLVSVSCLACAPRGDPLAPDEELDPLMAAYVLARPEFVCVVERTSPFIRLAAVDMDPIDRCMHVDPVDMEEVRQKYGEDGYSVVVGIYAHELAHVLGIRSQERADKMAGCILARGGFRIGPYLHALRYEAGDTDGSRTVAALLGYQACQR